jgi:hypothetical protein
MLHSVRVPPSKAWPPSLDVSSENTLPALHTKQQLPLGGRFLASPIHGSLSLASLLHTKVKTCFGIEFGEADAVLYASLLIIATE